MERQKNNFPPLLNKILKYMGLRVMQMLLYSSLGEISVEQIKEKKYNEIKEKGGHNHDLIVFGFIFPVLYRCR